MTTTTRIHDIDIDEFLASCVRIEPLALNEEFIRLPSDFAYWNERYARSQRLHASAKQQRERIYSQLLLEARARENAAAGPPPFEVKGKLKTKTVGEVEAAIIMDLTYQTAREAESDAEIECERINNVLNALRTKKDMLIQLGYQQRAEMSSDPLLRDHLMGERRKEAF